MTKQHSIKLHKRDKQKIFVENQEKFHASAGKQHWKSISELILHEIVNIEKKRGKKGQGEETIYNCDAGTETWKTYCPIKNASDPGHVEAQTTTSHEPAFTNAGDRCHERWCEERCTMKSRYTASERAASKRK